MRTIVNFITAANLTSYAKSFCFETNIFWRQATSASLVCIIDGDALDGLGFKIQGLNKKLLERLMQITQLKATLTLDTLVAFHGSEHIDGLPVRDLHLTPLADIGEFSSGSGQQAHRLLAKPSCFCAFDSAAGVLAHHAHTTFERKVLD